MKLDVWADFLCPYCYVSIRTLDEALQKTGKKIDYVHRAHQLAPELERMEGQSHFEWMAKELDMTVDEAKKDLEEGIGQTAKENGVPFHPEKAVPADTKKAHLLACYASENGRGQEAVTRLARAYYELGEDLEDDDTLRKIAEEAGLGEDDFSRAMDSPDCAQRLEKDRELFVEAKIESVPHYVVNDDIVLPESKTIDEFVEILEKYD